MNFFLESMEYLNKEIEGETCSKESAQAVG